MAYGQILGQSFETSPVLDNYFTKDETLTSNTAALYGLSRSAVPDDVLEKARSLITTAQNTANGVSSRLKVVTGSYSGTGLSSKTINFSVVPQVLIWSVKRNNVDQAIVTNMVFRGETTAACVNSTVGESASGALYGSLISVAFRANSVTLSSDSALICLNASGYTYNFVALCTT